MLYNNNMKMRIKNETLILLFIGVLFIIIGILEKQNIEVLKKATRICLECIGIG